MTHHSATYKNSPMPFMESLTRDGVTRGGGTVIISNSKKLPTMTRAQYHHSGALRRWQWKPPRH
ncbi:MAG: hypothetical protein H8M99_06680 [Gloeobacteraceae cyanobacterium ES-bin-144]|nr:hypothetical protein [Verrucomicrobiales bacterium]